MSALAKTGSAAVDLSRLSDVAATSKTLKIGDEVVDLSQTTALLKDDALYKTVLDNPDVIKFLDEADPKDLKEALGGINDTNRLQEIGKKLDKKTLDALKNVDGGADLVKKLDPSSAKKLNLAQRAKNAATVFTKASAAKLNQASKSIRKFMSGAENAPNNMGDVKRIYNKMEAAPAKQADTMAKETVGKVDDAGEAVKNTENVLKDGSEASNSLRKGLAELGITPGSVAIGAGVIVLLCMAYDTDNPFTAVDRALDDTGKVVKGFKEVADSAATAVKDTAKGGFDFISFVTENSWISFACSILCVILLFALFMTGMLGSMGGNNRR